MNLNHKNLTELPSLPDDLKFLYCSGNKLTYLPQLPNGLIRIYCWQNFIQNIENIPKGLIELSICENPLIHFPQLSPNLKKIWLSPWQIRSCLNNITNPKTSIVIYN
jgi:hypothetical protein